MENQLNDESQKIQSENCENEPEKLSDNSESFLKEESVSSGTKSEDIESYSDLILGKFKSVDDLAKAYQELQKYQGRQSEELGNLRQNAGLLSEIEASWARQAKMLEGVNLLNKTIDRYNNPEYFQDPSFKSMFLEAYDALGDNLDTDKFVNLLEGYVSSRIFAHEKARLADEETQSVINKMGFDKNSKDTFKASEKRLEEMTSEELDEFFGKYI